MAAIKRYSDSTNANRLIKNVSQKVTSSPSSARQFLKSAGIMTPKGNMSPKFK